ncbi:MAG: thiamine phosphate synthase [Magnetovibrio sp.]|nr:thiamine phosphate synthase [Magnetovibrio sp.]
MTCQLYLITPPVFDLDTFAPTFVEALEGGEVACVQLRMKTADGGPAPREEVLRAAKVLVPQAQDREVAFLINDDAELAAQLGADGVHVGQEDTSLKAARAVVGTDAIIGVTCHNSRHLAMEASEAGADYVAFGAFYPTTTKDPKTIADPEILEIWSTMTNVPCVAIGGITVENAPPLIKSGADFVAVVAGVWNHPDGPAHAVRQFNKLMDTVT